MKAFLFINGHDSATFLPTSFDDALLIAVDGGLRLLASLGRKPDYWIGDGDSLPENMKQFLPQRKCQFHLNPDKDYSDTDEAIRFALQQGVRELHLYGGGGGRLDHLYNNLYLVKKYPSIQQWHTSFESMEVVQQGIHIQAPKETIFSLIPLDQDAKVISTTGFHWPTEKWDFSQGISLSNRTNMEKATIMVDGGRFLLIKPREV